MSFKRILIVEDEFIIAEDIRASLQEHGYEVVAICGNGEEAFKKTIEKKPDLLLIDIVLEGEMTGYQLAQIVRSQLSIPIIYITAHSDKKTLEQVALTMPYGFIIKPFEDKELFAVLTMAYHKHNAELVAEKSEEKYKVIMKHIPEMLKVTDESANVIFISDSLHTLLGKAEISDNDEWLTLLHPQDKEKISTLYNQLEAQDDVQHCEYQIKNGENKYVRIQERIYPYDTESYGKLYYSIYTLL